MLKSRLLGAVGILAVVGGIAAMPSAQTPASPAFEVASIKRNIGVETTQNSRTLPGGRIEVTNMPLRTLIRIAYGSTGGQIVGGPSWVASDGYDIVAKAPPDIALEGTRGGPSPTLMAMLRSLLEERFQLHVHTEMRDALTYALVLANKGSLLGPRLKASNVDCNSPNACSIRGGNGDVIYTGLTIAQIATSIAGFTAVRALVVDRSGLAGRFDLHLQYNDDSGPNVFTALIEQAGLKLQPEKGQAEFIIVDHVGRPVLD